MTYHLEKFGRILLELRKERGWTQSTLAKKMNLSAQSVSKWERGTSYPDIELFPVLAEIFNVDIGVLFGKDKKKSTCCRKCFFQLYSPFVQT